MEDQLVEDLKDLGLPEGASVLTHTSLRAIGPIEGGAETLVRAFRRVLGSDGTLLVPTFNFESWDRDAWREPPGSSEEIESLRALLPVFDPKTSPTEVRLMGVFPEIVRQQPNAWRSDHPIVSFAAIGPSAAFLTGNTPFHYPFGSESPLARLHQLDGWVLLIGVGHTVNTSLHLAEVWAEVPYIHRSAQIKTAPGQYTTMQGSPMECSEGFSKIEKVLRQGRLLREGYVGNAPSQLMRQRQLISMAVAMLQGDPSSLLCDREECPWCSVARKLAAEPH